LGGGELEIDPDVLLDDMWDPEDPDVVFGELLSVSTHCSDVDESWK
jgi:hypothetical protein